MKYLAIILIVFISTMGLSQSTTNSTLPTVGAHLGWDDTGNSPLWINQNNTQRMRFGSQNWVGINGEAANNVTRITIPHIGITNEIQPAWSMLHLWDNDDSNFPFTTNMRRAWMDVGLSMTGNQDFLYLGMLERPIAPNADVQSDMVMAWGCQDATGNEDNFRFLYIEPVHQGTPPESDDQTSQGREIMRLDPNGNVGIGDFSTMTWDDGSGPESGLGQQPTHRLDVDGTARLRQMLSTTPDVFITGTEVDAVGDYELTYTSF